MTKWIRYPVLALFAPFLAVVVLCILVIWFLTVILDCVFNDKPLATEFRKEWRDFRWWWKHG